MRGDVHADDAADLRAPPASPIGFTMGKGAANVKSADLPLRGGLWVVVLAALLLAGLAAVARFMEFDRRQSARLDAFVRSTEPLPTPPPVNSDEMDPDKE
ncbi:hypothetical protein AYO41_04870 [Verrucomicrobia bacterium SCGC AG-212-E04]|nr:hypothetical protein AYO41_04870 [Verrucomicrobia bacterium SCGC AG-212-E04]